MPEVRDAGMWVVVDEGDDFQERYGLRISYLSEDLRRYHMELQQGEEYQPAQFGSEPIAYMSRQAVQHLFDNLWRAGFRPRGDGTPGQLEAQGRHIEDLKGISIRLLDIIDYMTRPILRTVVNNNTGPANDNEDAYARFLANERDRIRGTPTPPAGMTTRG